MPLRPDKEILTIQQVSWVPGVFAGEGSATLYYANFTKHPAHEGIVDALKNGTRRALGDNNDDDEGKDEDDD